ncbi:leucine-rich repeat domain-containing protein [Bacteroides sp.]
MKTTTLSSALFFFTIILFAACGNNDDSIDSDQLYATTVNTLKGNKWTSNYYQSNEYSYGVEIERQVFTLYFLTENTGLEYQVFRYEDSVGDKDRDTYSIPFTYEVKGDQIIINYSGNTDTFLYTDKALLSEGNSCHTYYEATPMTAADYEFLDGLGFKTGKCGTDLIYSYSKNTHLLTIEGKGEMTNYTSSNQPWHDYYIEQVSIKEGVTSVGDNAFTNIQHLTEVNLPNTLTKIGQKAFSDILISEIIIPESVIEIGDYAFSDCKYLKTLYWYDDSSKLQVIGKGAFMNAPITKEINSATNSYPKFRLPSNLLFIGDFAFMGAAIRELEMNDKLETVGNAVFTGVTGTVTIPNSVESVGGLAFEGSFSKVVIGVGLKSLAKAAFSSESAGAMYINLSTPLDVEGMVFANGEESKWNLYVPNGCKIAYSGKSPWNKFKTIYEDSSLDGENIGGEIEDGEESNTGIDEEELDNKDAKDYRRGPVSSSLPGNGTAASPYLISSAADLRYFSDAVRSGNIFKGKYVKLTSDITINKNVLDSNGEFTGDDSNLEKWIPIGRYDPSYFFCGIFDGGNHVINGIYYNRPDGNDAGLFGKVLGIVKNVTVKDSYISGYSNIGGIVGSCSPNYDSSKIQTSIKDYYNDRTLISKIENCHNYGCVKSKDANSGGIVGKADCYKNPQPQIKKCSNFGKVLGCKKVGGIVGFSKCEYIYDCYNQGSVTSSYAVSHTGGIVGSMYQAKGIIRNCINKGIVSSDGNRVAGICGMFGWMSSLMTNCVNVANISGTSSGALVGCMWKSCTVNKNYFLFIRELNGYGKKDGGTYSGNSSMTESEMKSKDFLDNLNRSVGTTYSKWKFGKDGYPTLEWINE